MRDAVLLTESADPHGLRQVYRVAFAGAVAFAGDPVEAVRVLHRVDPGERPAFRRYAAAVDVVEAGVSAAGGHWRDATSMALRAAARASELGQPILQAEALYDAVRYTAVRDSSERPAGGVRSGAPPRQVRDQGGPHRSIVGRLAGQLARVAGTTDSVLVAVCADVAAALARDDGPALDALAVAFDQLDTPLFAAETAAAASDAYRDAGQPSAAGEAAERARRLVEKCPQPPGLALAQSDAVGRLTRREREMAVLAAQLTSREIARQLSLSVRTVDNHLARVYAKLGIATRAELPVVLGQRPAEPSRQARARHRYRADPAFGREQGGAGAALRRSSAG